MNLRKRNVLVTAVIAGAPLLACSSAPTGEPSASSSGEDLVTMPLCAAGPQSFEGLWNNWQGTINPTYTWFEPGNEYTDAFGTYVLFSAVNLSAGQVEADVWVNQNDVSDFTAENSLCLPGHVYTDTPSPPASGSSPRCTVDVTPTPPQACLSPSQLGSYLSWPIRSCLPFYDTAPTPVVPCPPHTL